MIYELGRGQEQSVEGGFRECACGDWNSGVIREEGCGGVVGALRC